MSRRFFDLLFRPRDFFTALSREKIAPVPPLVIVLAGALLPVIFTLAVTIPLTLLSSSHIISIGWQPVLILFLCDLGLPLAGWALLSFWIRAVPPGPGGTRSLAAAFRDTGYGMLPWTLSIIGFFLFSGILYLIGFLVPAAVMGEFATGAYWVYAYLVPFPVLAWEWYLWTVAITISHQFPFRKSALITGIPVAVYAIILIVSLYWQGAGFW